ncbi:hypothetical protein [Vibrio sp. LaRot3]|uniref:hypothetical protein n=1 Tax=Vibrio sp. LaRot3 TaxID=2998829 RepID=UPI0022CE0981|nr:hypothetical protein [Vibrio sp. LaRot3]MDA0149793.1 hypothetical protein [Vibrio sp. LaRot3]
MFENYLDTLKSLELRIGNKELPNSLLLEQSGNISVYYAPFDYINANAKIVICGITPGFQQAVLALEEATKQLKNGASIEEAKLAAKNTASFGGPMRSNLIRLLDFVGINQVLGLSTTSELFGKSSHLVHYTSALRYPVFKAGKNYSGTPSMLSNPVLRNQLETHLLTEFENFADDTIYVPLGPKVEEALQFCVQSGVIKSNQVLSGLPHPSGANAERIAYFLNEKPKEALSIKTNPEKIDTATEALLRQVSQLKDAKALI